MLVIDVVMSESYDEANEKFVRETFRLELEHSLVSLSKWESKFEKRFLDDEEKTTDEVIAYIKDMNVTPEIPPEVFLHLTQSNIDEIQKYIDSKQSATTFREDNKPNSPSRQKISSELIYYWMTSYQIPWEAQHWHLSRLFALIRVFNEHNKKDQPRSRSSIAEERRKLNAQRRAQMGSRG